MSEPTPAAAENPEETPQAEPAPAAEEPEKTGEEKKEGEGEDEEVAKNDTDKKSVYVKNVDYKAEPNELKEHF